MLSIGKSNHIPANITTIACDDDANILRIFNAVLTREIATRRTRKARKKG